jgi:glycosyltransferase involved in cell wall biosynthesis
MQWHLITGEYPPQPGGVSDYTQQVAKGLAEAGEEVHVWAPASERTSSPIHGVTVHYELGRLSLPDLYRAGRLLDQYPKPRRLLVQWTPQAYQYRSLNLPFCYWIWKRAYFARDRVDLMAHEAFLSFFEGTLRQSAAAFFHRLMVMTLLNAVKKVWVSTPGWERLLRIYTLGRRVDFHWLPVPSNIPVIQKPSDVAMIRARYAPRKRLLACHFGAYCRKVNKELMWLIPELLRVDDRLTFMLIGRGGAALCNAIAICNPDIAARVHATGGLLAEDLSLHLSACDLMVQPYPEGVNSRRSSVIAGLAHGLPIVTTAGPLTESLWKESRAVLIAPVDDVGAMYSGVSTLLNDSARRNALSKAATSLYHKQFALDHTISALLAPTLK